MIQHPQRLFLNESIPEQFINAEIGDWVYLVGDITTQYEAEFIQQFGYALKKSCRENIDVTHDRLEISFDALMGINRELLNITNRVDHIYDLLTPIPRNPKTENHNNLLHSLRCETCEYEGVSDETDSCPGEWICEKTGMQINEVTRSFISIIGCASHDAKEG